MNTNASNPLGLTTASAKHVFHETLLEDHRHDGLRSGEGSVVSLADGSLLMIYTHFDGPGDEDKATLVARTSNDDGVTWSDRSVFEKTPDVSLNVMSVSLLRLNDDSVAAIYLVKHTMKDCRAWLKISKDHGRTWSKPSLIMPRDLYHCVNNDRLIQLSTGRLLLPYHYYPVGPGKGRCGCIYSDDLGQSWEYGDVTFLTPETVSQPAAIDPTNADAVEAARTGDIHVREPGLIELQDGSVLMWARSTGGYVYHAFSMDGGETWGPLHAFTELVAPSSPQSVARLPGSNRLIMLLNHRGVLAYGSPQFQWRRPLTVAVSDDDASSWQLHGLLEPQTVPSNCYYSICFHKSSVIFTYYEGEMHVDKTGQFLPRSLASLKLKIVDLSWFE